MSVDANYLSGTTTSGNPALIPSSLNLPNITTFYEIASKVEKAVC